MIDRTGQVWTISNREVFLVVGPKTLSTQHSEDRWWMVVYLDGQTNALTGVDDILFEASDRTWERRSALRRIS